MEESWLIADLLIRPATRFCDTIFVEAAWCWHPPHFRCRRL